MKYCFIANPHARNGRGLRKLDALRTQLGRRGIRFDLALCETLEHAVVLSRKANQSAYDVVVAVGGDGTINRVLNGFYGSDGTRISQARLGVIHIGTSPDFCRSYGVPIDVIPAVDVLVRGTERQVRVGRVIYGDGNGKTGGTLERTACFGCCANIGLGASLARRANGGIRKYAGDFLGTFLCLLAVLRTCRPQRVAVTLDGANRELEDVCNVAVGRSHYIASGLKVSHDLQPQDDRFYVLFLRNLRLCNFPRLLFALYSGHLPAAGPCLSMEYARTIAIRSGPMEVEFDGDPAGWCPCRIETAPDPLDLIVGGPA